MILRFRNSQLRTQLKYLATLNTHALESIAKETLSKSEDSKNSMPLARH